MGADFSDSAGVIARRGATEFSSVAVKASIFGAFDEAEQFQRAVVQSHAIHSEAMQTHHAALNQLAEKATSAATVFTEVDARSGSVLNATQPTFDV